MGDSLSALSIICGILAALYVNYESKIQDIIDEEIPDYPENCTEKYEEIKRVLSRCVKPLLIASPTMAIILLPETIAVIENTIIFIRQEWSVYIFNPQNYDFASIMVIVIQILFIFLYIKTKKWKGELNKVKKVFDNAFNGTE